MLKKGPFWDLIKRTKDTTLSIPKKEELKIEIHIEGDINLFKDEKKQILILARQLLEAGRESNMEEAIISAAVMVRGLRYLRTETCDGIKTIILRETASLDNERD